MLLSLPFFKPTPESLVRKLADLPPAPKVLHTLQRILLVEDTTIDDIATAAGTTRVTFYAHGEERSLRPRGGGGHDC